MLAVLTYSHELVADSSLPKTTRTKLRIAGLCDCSFVELCSAAGLYVC